MTSLASDPSVSKTPFRESPLRESPLVAQTRALVQKGQLLGLQAYSLLCDVTICDRLLSPPLDFTALARLRRGQILGLNGEMVYRAPDFEAVLSQLRANPEARDLEILVFLIEPYVREDLLAQLAPFATRLYVVNKHLNSVAEPTSGSVTTPDSGENKSPSSRSVPIHNLPIGFRDPLTCPGYSHDALKAEAQSPRPKDLLCLLCYTEVSHPDRAACSRALGEKSWVHHANRLDAGTPTTRWTGCVPVEKYAELVNRAKYVLAPVGCGPATHRFYEALYLRAIPIVRLTGTPFDGMYSREVTLSGMGPGVGWPCLVVREWHEVTEELLLEQYPVLSQRVEDFFRAHPNWAESPNWDGTTSLLEFLRGT